MKLVFNKRSGAVVMSPDSEGLGAAAVAGVGSNLTQPSSTVDSRCLELAYLEKPLISKWKSGPCLNMKI